MKDLMFPPLPPFFLPESYAQHTKTFFSSAKVLGRLGSDNLLENNFEPCKLHHNHIPWCWDTEKVLLLTQFITVTELLKDATLSYHSKLDHHAALRLHTLRPPPLPALPSPLRSGSSISFSVSGIINYSSRNVKHLSWMFTICQRHFHWAMPGLPA